MNKDEPRPDPCPLSRVMREERRTLIVMGAVLLVVVVFRKLF
ncbi:MAG: hypothetical protein QM682_02800 [Paracoccus sp. (in: a-proteobacteria)]